MFGRKNHSWSTNSYFVEKLIFGRKKIIFGRKIHFLPTWYD